VLKEKTRVLVTHAVDFVHLADRIIIMKQGQVCVEGTYEQLKETEVMQEIIDIHNKNKQHTKDKVKGQEGPEVDPNDVTCDFNNSTILIPAESTDKLLIGSGMDGEENKEVEAGFGL